MGMAIGAIGVIAAQQRRDDYYDSYGYGYPSVYYGGGPVMMAAGRIMAAAIIICVTNILSICEVRGGPSEFGFRTPGQATSTTGRLLFASDV